MSKTFKDKKKKKDETEKSHSRGFDKFRLRGLDEYDEWKSKKRNYKGKIEDIDLDG